MFNSLTPEQVTLALAAVLQREGRADEPKDGYRRSQLLSASSVARHLAAEQAAHRELSEWLADRLDELLSDREDPASVRAHACLAQAGGGAEASGDALARVLAARSEGDEELRRGLHRVLRELCDREVAALAAATA